MSETSKKIIDTIHERHIEPRPKWYFLLRNTAVWASLVIALFLGALSMALQETVLEGGGGGGAASFLSGGVSFLWLFFSVLFAVLAYYNLRLTNDGYRYRAAWIILAILLVFVGFGVLFHHEGVDDRAESLFENVSWMPFTLH